MYTKQELKKELYELIKLCEEEIKKCKDEKRVNFIIDCVIPESYSLIWQINIDKLPLKGYRRFNSAEIIVDSFNPWNDSKVLQSKIFYIYNVYGHGLED